MTKKKKKTGFIKATTYRFLRVLSDVMGRHIHVWANSKGFLLIARDRRNLRIIRTAGGSWATSDRGTWLGELTEAKNDMMAKRLKRAGDQPKPPHALYDDLLETMPAFAEFMVGSQFEDGTPRKGGWLAIWAQGGSWRAKIKNDAEGLEIELAAPSWRELLALVEGSLLDPNAPWRSILGWQDPTAPKKGRK